jgi:hypothetical protein
LALSSTNIKIMSKKHSISVDAAKKMTRHFREKKDSMLSGDYKKKGSLPVCETFERGAFDEVLANPECVGLRVYFAMDEELMVRVVIVGVNDKDEDMINKTSTQTTAFRSSLVASDTTDTDPVPSDGGTGIIEQGTRCPDVCPPASPLNS